jgi:hypothetical protein
MEQTAAASPRRIARIAGLFYLGTFLTGILALVAGGSSRAAANLVAGACYVVVIVLFYFLFEPASSTLSLLAAIVGVAGCVNGPLTDRHLVPFHLNSLVFFGFYCLLISALIFRSTFLPRWLGALMAFAALGWLTFLSPVLAKQLAPFNMIPGMVGEAVLTLWLLVAGVDAAKWTEQARGDARRRNP